MPVWTTSHDECEHVRALMMCVVYFGGRRAKLELKSGRFLIGLIVSTNFGTDLPDRRSELHGQAALSAGRMFGELHILPEVGSLVVLQAIEIATIEPFDHARVGARSPRSMKA
jgi:hypothetical protein